MPSFIMAPAIPPTGIPTTPNPCSTPCVFSALAIICSPVISPMIQTPSLILTMNLFKQYVAAILPMWGWYTLFSAATTLTNLAKKIVKACIAYLGENIFSISMKHTKHSHSPNIYGNQMKPLVIYPQEFVTIS